MNIVIVWKCKSLIKKMYIPTYFSIVIVFVFVFLINEYLIVKKKIKTKIRLFFDKFYVRVI